MENNVEFEIDTPIESNRLDLSLKTKNFVKRMFLLRLIIFPFWVAISIIASIYIGFRSGMLYLFYGGSVITYLHDDRPNIYRIYQELKTKTNEN